jgi:hypothetical protein
MKSPEWISTHKDKLYAIRDIIDSNIPLFRGSPENSQGLVIHYYDFLAENGASIQNLEQAMQNLTLKTKFYPVLFEIKEELDIILAEKRIAVKEPLFSVVSFQKFQECQNDKSLITGRYIAGTLFTNIKQSQVAEYHQLVESHKDEALFYEVAYCRCFEVKIPIKSKKPAMILKNIWEYSGMIKFKPGEFNLDKLISQLQDKMGMKNEQ